MNDIEAIASLEEIQRQFENSIVEADLGDTDAIEALEDNKISVSSLELAIQALQEKAERDKGCDFCNIQKPIEFDSGYYGYMGEDKPVMKIYDDIEPSIQFIRGGNGTYFNINFCPNCGRDLRK